MSKKPKISKHGKTRMKERNGISSNYSETIVKRAIAHGIRPDDTSGELRQWILNRRRNRNTEIYLYAGMAYVISGNTLVTAISIPTEINKNLKEYVQQDAYVKYEKYRKSLHRETDERRQQSSYFTIDRNTIKAMVNRFFKENSIPFMATNVSRDYLNRYIVHFVSDNPKEDRLYTAKVRDWAERERGINLILRHNKRSDGSYVLMSECDV